MKIIEKLENGKIECEFEKSEINKTFIEKIEKSGFFVKRVNSYYTNSIHAFEFKIDKSTNEYLFIEYDENMKIKYKDRLYFKKNGELTKPSLKKIRFESFEITIMYSLLLGY